MVLLFIISCFCVFGNSFSFLSMSTNVYGLLTQSAPPLPCFRKLSFSQIFPNNQIFSYFGNSGEIFRLYYKKNITKERIMFCASCGTKIEEGVKFCSGCGKAIGGAPSEPASPVVAAQPQTVAVQPQSIMADEKYCFSCGYVIKKAAELCPKCGVNQNSRNSTTAIDIYCTSCGKLIKKVAPACPFCGVKQDNEKANFGFAALSFVVPFAGWILAIVWRKSSPRKAKSCLIWGSIGFVFWLIIPIIGNL
jgi:predicted RNA-binding Zn-ribbon protein involved in translation (DUF1610 family)